MKKYEHLFFDLDRTLWDFNRNSFEAISDLFYKYGLDKKLGVEIDVFFEKYDAINHALWAKYRVGEVTKDELRSLRFHTALVEFGLEDSTFALSFNDSYVSLCSAKPNLVLNTKEILDYLKPKYKMHIITNGFKEAQHIKLKNSGLVNYFDQVIISDEFGYRKPDERIFHYAMEKAGAKPEHSLMIGDDYVPDIVGAQSVNIDQVFFALKIPEEGQTATYTITSLLELKDFL